MEITTILADIFQAVKLAQMAFQIGADAGPHITDAYELFTGKRTWTAEDRAKAYADENAYHATLQAPLP